MTVVKVDAGLEQVRWIGQEIEGVKEHILGAVEEVLIGVEVKKLGVDHAGLSRGEGTGR